MSSNDARPSSLRTGISKSGSFGPDILGFARRQEALSHDKGRPRARLREGMLDVFLEPDPLFLVLRQGPEHVQAQDRVFLRSFPRGLAPMPSLEAASFDPRHHGTHKVGGDEAPEGNQDDTSLLVHGELTQSGYSAP